MGLENHGTNFLRYALQRNSFGAVATIGRQELHITGRLAAHLKLDRSSEGAYCEEFLQTFFGATRIDSFDNSDYENATHIVDMNLPIDRASEFDTVIDAGTLEHIYNVPQALSNISQLCRVGGQIIHILPSNNECGHGFWQFSPELFFSLYSESNGYRETVVFIASRDDERNWYEVRKPINANRAYIQSLAPLVLMCRTRKISNHSHRNVQQSDYTYLWGANCRDVNEGQIPNKTTQTAPDGRLLTFAKTKTWKIFGGSAFFLTFFRILHMLFFSKTAVSTRNPSLIKRPVEEVTGGSPAHFVSSVQELRRQ